MALQMVIEDDSDDEIIFTRPKFSALEEENTDPQTAFITSQTLDATSDVSKQFTAVVEDEHLESFQDDEGEVFFGMVSQVEKDRYLDVSQHPQRIMQEDPHSNEHGVERRSINVQDARERLEYMVETFVSRVEKDRRRDELEEMMAKFVGQVKDQERNDRRADLEENIGRMAEKQRRRMRLEKMVEKFCKRLEERETDAKKELLSDMVQDFVRKYREQEELIRQEKKRKDRRTTLLNRMLQGFVDQLEEQRQKEVCKEKLECMVAQFVERVEHEKRLEFREQLKFVTESHVKKARKKEMAAKGKAIATALEGMVQRVEQAKRRADEEKIEAVLKEFLQRINREERQIQRMKLEKMVQGFVRRIADENLSVLEQELDCIVSRVSIEGDQLTASSLSITQALLRVKEEVLSDLRDRSSEELAHLRHDTVRTFSSLADTELENHHKRLAATLIQAAGRRYLCAKELDKLRRERDATILDNRNRIRRRSEETRASTSKVLDMLCGPSSLDPGRDTKDSTSSKLLALRQQSSSAYATASVEDKMRLLNEKWEKKFKDLKKTDEYLRRQRTGASTSDKLSTVLEEKRARLKKIRDEREKLKKMISQARTNDQPLQLTAEESGERSVSGSSNSLPQADAQQFAVSDRPNKRRAVVWDPNLEQNTPNHLHSPHSDVDTPPAIMRVRNSGPTESSSSFRRLMSTLSGIGGQ